MKSKIKIIILVFILLLVGVACSIPKSTYEKWFNSNSQEELDENVETKLIYVKNTSGKLVGLEVPIKEENDDEIMQKWNLLTIHSSNIPSGYTTPLNTKTSLESYQIKDSVLELNVSNEITSSEGRATIESLAWTFINDEIKEVKLIVDGNEVKEISDYLIRKIDKNIGINLEYETNYLYEAIATTLVYYEQDYILPVTYLHLEKDVCSYIVEKTYDNYQKNEEVWNYEYTLTEESLEVNFTDELKVEQNVLLTLSHSFDFNLNIINLSINNSNANLYQTVFGEIVEE